MTKVRATSGGPSARCEPRQTKLERYFARVPQRARAARPRRAPIVAARGDVVALWDASRTALAAWEAAGFVAHYVFSLDAATALDPPPVFACAFPDSTDLSIAGARWFSQKRARNPHFQELAAAVFWDTEALFRRWGCPYFVEGPAVGRLARLWRPPDLTYNPCDYGGYLDARDDHPQHPGIIPRRDAYTRFSGLWVGSGFRPPAQRAVEPAWRYYYSARHRAQRRMNPVLFARGDEGRRARACPPRGFVRAVCLRLTRS